MAGKVGLVASRLTDTGDGYGFGRGGGNLDGSGEG